MTLEDDVIQIFSDHRDSHWRVAEALLLRWIESGDSRSPWHDDATREEAEELAMAASEHIAELSIDVGAIAALSSPLSANQQAYALGMAIDRTSAAQFTSQWLSERGELFVLEPGQLYPVSKMGLKGASGYSAQPHRLHLPSTEFPHVRQLQRDDVEVQIDARWGGLLDALLAYSPLKVAAVLPNEGWAELTPMDTFPICAVDENLQTARIRAAVERALTSRVAAIVVPELATPHPTLTAIQELISVAPDICLVFAGSEHVTIDGSPKNRASVLLTDAGIPAWEQEKAIPFEDRDGNLEPIDRQRLVLRVATGNHVRVAALVCKDYLSENYSDLLGDLGVHLVGVPAASARLGDFGTAGQAIVRRSQGSSVVANGPRVWQSELAEHALIVHPVSGSVRVAVADGGPAPGLTVGQLGAGWRGYDPVQP
jgi:hypothetical protein